MSAPGRAADISHDPAAAPSLRNVHLLDAREALLNEDRHRPTHPQLDQHVDVLGDEIIRVGIGGDEADPCLARRMESEEVGEELDVERVLLIE